MHAAELLSACLWFVDPCVVRCGLCAGSANNKQLGADTGTGRRVVFFAADGDGAGSSSSLLMLSLERAAPFWLPFTPFSLPYPPLQLLFPLFFAFFGECPYSVT